MKSLAELRSSKAISRPERSLTLCLAPHLVAEVQSLTDELTTLPVSRDDGEPRRAGQSSRAVEIKGRLGALFDEMAEHSGEMRLRATRTDGEWRRWCDDNPAREEGAKGYDRDERVAYGYCNADALLDDLATYAVEWNGEPLESGDWVNVFEPQIGSADKAQMAQAVVAMYETRVDFQRWRNGLQGNLKRLNGSASLATLESATNDSTDGNPEPSSTGTTSSESAAE